MNFLDITFDLNQGTYKPFSKPNNDIMYINTKSNHPPNIIKYIPSMISDRISKISSNEKIFNRAAPQYNAALESSGYQDKITYNNRPKRNRKPRRRQIIWFNPPFNLNVKTKVAERFFAILEKNFPKNTNSIKSWTEIPPKSATVAYQTFRESSHLTIRNIERKKL